MGKKTISIKLGGSAADNPRLLESLVEDIKKISTSYNFLLFHGGGAEVTALTRKFGIEPVFKNGVRMTSDREMAFVDMVLSGKINKQLVRLLQKNGFDAVGLSGSDGKIFTGKSIGENGESQNHTGKITLVNPGLLSLLLSNGYLPVISSTSMDLTGMPLNINADTACFSVSSELKTDMIVFLSDTEGVLKENRVLECLSGGQAASEIKNGTISGGMIPKVEAACDAIAKGVKRVVIGTITESIRFIDLIEGRKGTRIG
ncbi:MAG: acetylglutamate kinase [Spirochaetales bacterium]|nr:acetylglutamate kinase [Spirochaetales bacterium]